MFALQAHVRDDDIAGQGDHLFEPVVRVLRPAPVAQSNEAGTVLRLVPLDFLQCQTMPATIFLLDGQGQGKLSERGQGLQQEIRQHVLAGKLFAGDADNASVVLASEGWGHRNFSRLWIQ